MDDILKSLFDLDLLVNYSVGYLTIYQISQLCDYNLVTTTTNTKFEKIKQKTIGACKFSDKVEKPMENDFEGENKKNSKGNLSQLW